MKEYRVGVRELKSNLSSVLRDVKSGNTVVITESAQRSVRYVVRKLSSVICSS
jgi:antitoxin (DNA-binding transcriptional repressor) of toxin-antitoxin stability system